jgi:SAM-dependent methyltransferase
MPERYCTKTGYRPNEQALTFEEDESGAYWTQWRIEAAAVFQYYVYKKCLSLLQSRGYDSLLDVGCGFAVKVKQLLAPHCHDIVLIDQPSLAQPLSQLLPQSEFIPVNLERINFDLSRKFDLIVCADVLEHLLNPDNCVAFIRRHLASNGLAVFSTPERDHLRGKSCDHSPKPEHVREWNGAEFAEYITSRGFEIVEHLYLPQRRLSQAEFLCSRILSRFIRNRRWSSCQVIVCRSIER